MHKITFAATLVLVTASSLMAQVSFDSALHGCQAGKICDLTSYSGSTTLYVLTEVDIPANTVVKLPDAVILTSAVIRVAQGSSLVGAPITPAGNIPLMGPPPKTPPQIPPVAPTLGTIIKANTNFPAGAVVELDGGGNLLQDLTVDGDGYPTFGSNIGGPNRGLSFVDIFINRATSTMLTRVLASRSPQHGILIFSDPIASNGNQSCCAKFDHVFADFNGSDGILANNTADIFISMSEFENNVQTGVELFDSPAWRIEHSDMGGNGNDGIRAVQTVQNGFAGLQIIIGNQFGNNFGDDIEILNGSSNNLISSNAFIGNSGNFLRKPSAYGVFLGSSANNSVTGNAFSGSPYGCVYSTNNSNLLFNLCNAQ